MVETFFHQQLQFTRLFKKKLNEKLNQADLFYSQWLVLYCIYHNESITAVEISNYLNVEKPTISRTVKRLEDQGLIELEPSEDKRERRLKLSKKGIDRYQQGQEIVTAFEEDLLNGFTESDITTTLNTIQKLKEKM